MQEMIRRVGLARNRYGSDGRQPLAARQGRFQSVFHLRSVEMHRVLALRARLRGSAGHVRADGRRARLRVADRRPAWTRASFIRNASRAAPACRPARPATLIEKTSSRWARRSVRSSPPAPIAASAAISRSRCKGDDVVRMVPWKDGKANHGHSCVKGRFAWGYANHQDRILKPMVRAKITDPWREVTWEEAIGRVASEFKRIQKKHGTNSVGVITSSRCTDEETYLMQKLVRAVFGNNNIDTCARVCHSPTGYGLSKTFGTSAGTQDFDSVDDADVIMVIGANPTDAHPVFASRMKKRLRAGREADRDRSAPHRPRALAACRGAISFAAAARHQCRDPQRHRACRRDRKAGRRKFRAKNAATRRLSPTGPRSSSRPENSPETARAIYRRAGGPGSRARRGSLPPAATARSITGSASPSTARAPRR